LSRAEQGGLERGARARADDAIDGEGVAALEELNGGSRERAHQTVFREWRRRYFEIVQSLLDAESRSQVELHRLRRRLPSGVEHFIAAAYECELTTVLGADAFGR